MKGIIYSRVSTEQQDYARQTRMLKDYAASKHIKIIDILEEKESGRHDDRAKLNELKQYTSKDVDIVLVWELSRLSRRSVFLQQTIEEFINKGIRVFSFKENFNTHNPDGSINQTAQLVLAITATMAQQELETMRIRTQASRDHKIIYEDHSYSTNRMFGYDVVGKDKKLVINEDEAKIVRRIFQMCIDGLSGIRIATILNAENVTPYKKWTGSVVIYLLSCAKYYGDVEYKGHKLTIPAIITKEEFDQARNALQSRRNRHNSTVSKHPPMLLKNLIVCPCCGKNFTYEWYKDAKKPKTRYYSCVSKLKVMSYLGIKCTSSSICVHNLDYMIWHLISNLFGGKIAQEVIEETKKPLLEKLAELELTLKKYNLKIKELEDESKDKMDTAFTIKKVNPKLFDEAIKRIESIGKEIEQLEVEIKSVESRIKRTQNKLKSIEKGTDYTITEFSDKYDFLHRVVESITPIEQGFGKKAVIVKLSNSMTYQLFFYFNCGNRISRFFYRKDDGSITINPKTKEMVITKSFKGLPEGKIEFIDFWKTLEGKEKFHQVIVEE